MKKKYRMSRGGRLALNLVLLCVLVVFIWGLLGFSSPSYFSQSFRKLEGVSPMEYRRQSKM